jgi:hypothetical protein
MERRNKFKKYLLFVSLLVFVFISKSTIGQPVVGLDNWYNSEVSANGGIPFHYLWTDTAFSGYSRWGKIFVARGARLKTLQRPAKEVLGKVDIFIIVDPDTTSESKSPNYLLPEDIQTIEQWVKNGGVLALLGNDGPNCEFTHLNQLASKFGMKFNHVTLHPVTGADFETGASSDLPDHLLFKGVTKIFLKEVSCLNLSGKAKAILTENGKVLMAENRYGKGYVFAIGDPWIYNEYIDNDRLPVTFGNRRAAENLTDLLISYTKKR